MTIEITEILERLHACEVGIEAQRGYLKAMEYALRLCVLTHPAPEDLSATWHQLLPTIAAKHRAESSDLFAAAFEQALTILTEQIGAN